MPKKSRKKMRKMSLASSKRQSPRDTTRRSGMDLTRMRMMTVSKNKRFLKKRRSRRKHLRFYSRSFKSKNNKSLRTTP